MKALASAAAFQLVWYLCVVGGDFIAMVTTGVYLLLHRHFFMNAPKEWYLVGVFLLAGIVFDGLLIGQGFLRFSDSDVTSYWELPPLWLLCLWVSVGTLFSHALKWARTKPLVLIGASFIGPPLSYLIGAEFAGAALAEPLAVSLALIGVIWAVVLWFANRLAVRWLDVPRPNPPLN